MRVFLVVVGVMVGGCVMAAGAPVSNQFTAGDPIVANDMNANFQELADRIDTNQTAINQSNSNQLKQLVGFSTGTAVGGQGLKVYTALCNASYTGSRICTSEEIVKTTIFPNLPVSTSAWVVPVLVGSGSGRTTLNDIPISDKYSGKGAINAANMTCDGWSSNLAGSGLAISDTVQFMLPLCRSVINVACCM